MSDCTINALKTLSVPILQSLSTLISIAKENLNVLKAKKQLLALSLQIELLPLQAAQTVLNATVSQLRSAVNIVPSSAIIACPEIGNLNTMLETSISAPVEGATNALFDIQRRLSLQAENQADIDNIDSIATFFDSLDADIKSILSS